MKTSLTVLLVFAGTFFMACAGVAWSQSGYVCYNQVQRCGTYGGQCYPVQGTCPGYNYPSGAYASSGQAQ